MAFRLEKINSEMQKHLALIIQREVDDPVGQFLSLTRVEVTRDLREAKVFYSLLDERKYQHAQEVLDKMKKLIRMLLGKQIRLKITPELTFIADTSIKYSVEIGKKIDEVLAQDKLLAQQHLNHEKNT